LQTPHYASELVSHALQIACLRGQLGVIGTLIPELMAKKVCDAAFIITAEDSRSSRSIVTCSHSVQRHTHQLILRDLLHFTSIKSFKLSNHRGWGPK